MAYVKLTIIKADEDSAKLRHCRFALYSMWNTWMIITGTAMPIPGGIFQQHVDANHLDQKLNCNK